MAVRMRSLGCFLNSKRFPSGSGGSFDPIEGHQRHGALYVFGIPLEAVCGNLGWNTQDFVLVQRMKALLGDVGVPSDRWHGEFCELPTGSTVKLVFRSAQERRSAELRVTRAEKHFLECAPNKFAYIGPRKSSIERAPSTIVNELEKVIQDLETRANKTDDAARLSVSRGDRFGE